MAWRNYQKAVPEEPPFCLKSVEPTDGPEGGEGDWFSYVIEQGDNQITGMRAGEESIIRRELGEMIERLNERRIGKSRTKSKTKVAPKPTVDADSTEHVDIVAADEAAPPEAADVSDSTLDGEAAEPGALDET